MARDLIHKYSSFGTICDLRMKLSMKFLLALTLILSYVPEGKGSTPSSSIIDIGKIGSRRQDGELMSILTYRDVEENPVLYKASDIIKTRLASSTPLQDAAVKLIQTCKTANSESQSPTSSDKVKEIAKQIFAIKVTDENMSSASVQSPRVCHAFSGHTQTSWFRAYFSAADVDDFTEAASARSRSACLRELYKTDNSWTTYLKNLQDANSLCEISSVDHAPRMMLELLKDITDIVPSLAEMFRQQESRQTALLEQQQRYARELAEFHQIQLRDTEEQHEIIRQKAKDRLEETKDFVDDITQKLRRELQAARGDIGEIQTTVEVAITNFLTVRDTHNLILQQYQSLFADVTALQTRGMDDIEGAFRTLVYTMNEVHGGLTEQFNSLSIAIQTRMNDIAISQIGITQSQTEMMALQDRSIKIQNETIGLSAQLKDELSGWIVALKSVMLGFQGMIELWRLWKHVFIASAGVISLSVLLFCLGQRILALKLFLVCSTICGFSSIWKIIHPYGRAAATNVDNGLSVVADFFESRRQTVLGVLISSSLLAAIAILFSRTVHVRRKHKAAAQTRPLNFTDRQQIRTEMTQTAAPPRSLRAQTAAPDFYRPGPTRGTPRNTAGNRSEDRTTMGFQKSAV